MKTRFIFTLLLTSIISSTLSAQSVCITSLEKEIIDAINNHRASKNLGELAISKTLMITANKNMENLLNKNYLILKADEFGDYKAETAYIRTSISGTTSADIIRTITTPSEYTQHSKIIENTGDYTKYNWKTIGICIRSTNDPYVPTSIIIYFGEKSEPGFNPEICTSEIFFELNTADAYKPPLENPILRFTATDRVSVYSTYTDADGKRKQVENGFHVYEKGERAGAYLNEPSAKYYEVFISTFIPSIVTQEDVVVKIYPDEVSDTIIKNIELKGNTLQDVKDYLNNGGDINAQDDRKYTMLLRAAWRDDAEIVEYLLENGADVNILSAYYESPLTFTSSEKVYDLLMSKNPKLDLPIEPGSKYTLMHSFASNGLLKGVKYLVEEKKFNFEAKNVKDATPLFNAIMDDQVAVAEYLLGKGAKLEKAWESYPIHEASHNQNIEMLHLLLKYDAKKHINLFDASGNAPLHYAVIDGNLEIIKILLENGANINLKNTSGYTPIQYCENLMKNKEEIEAYLKSKGAK